MVIWITSNKLITELQEAAKLMNKKMNKKFTKNVHEQFANNSKIFSEILFVY